MKREDMEAIINGGGSVLHNGKLIVSIDKLPSAGDLASSEEDKAAAVDDLDKKIAEMTKQRNALKKTEKTDGDNEVDGFPEGFPARAKAALEKLGKTYSEVQTLSREGLIELDGIAATTADEILAFVNKK